MQTRIALRVFGGFVAAISVALLLAGGSLAGARGASFGELLRGWSIAEWSIGWSFALVGAILTARRERHPVAWLTAATGVSVAMESFTGQLKEYIEAVGGSELVSAALGWLGPTSPLYLLQPPPLGLLAILLLLFPNGRLPSGRWRWLIYVVAAAMAVAMLAEWGVWPITVYDGAEAVWLVALPLAAASLVWRVRRADGAEKQQLKVVAYATAGVIVGFFAGVALRVAPVTNAVLLPLIPGSVGVAVLRYRLYDIDRIISRTVAWTLLTGLLVATYLASTLLLGALLQPWTGRSTVSVAGSTLIVAALVGPLRRVVQSAVDRRFNRSRHDAVRTVQAFQGQLRSELDLDRLSDELSSVVEQTLEPTTVNLWLRTGH